MKMNVEIIQEHVPWKSLPMDYPLAMEVFQSTRKFRHPELHDVLWDETLALQVDWEEGDEKQRCETE